MKNYINHNPLSMLFTHLATPHHTLTNNTPEALKGNKKKKREQRASRLETAEHDKFQG